MANVSSGDLAAFSIEGNSQLDYLPNVEFEGDFTVDDGAPITGTGERNEVTKKGGTFRCALFSDDTNSRVSNLDVTGFSVDAVDYITYLRGGRLRYSVPNQESSGVGSIWMAPQPLPNRRQFSATATLQVPAASATANALRILGAVVKSADREDHIAVLILTVNGVVFELPMTVKNVKFTLDRDALLIVDIELLGRAPVSGTYPTTPSGTTTLIEKAFNASATALAFVFTPHNDAGFGTSFTGNMVISDMEFAWEDARIIRNSFTYLTTGAIAGSDT